MNLRGIADQTPYTYDGILTRERLESVIKDVMYSSELTKKPEIKLLTGVSGMWEFDFAFFLQSLGIEDNLKVKYIFNHTPRARNKSKDILNNKSYRKSEFRYIHLIEKAGKYKLKIYKDKGLPIHFYEGTKLISQSNSFEYINTYLKNI